MDRVTVVVRDDVVIIRGRDATGTIRATEVVPLAEMTERHVEMMRRRHAS